VVGKVVGNQERFDSENDHSYQAIVEYTVQGVPYSTPDGPQRSFRWQAGEAVQLYHIPWGGEPGRHVRPGAVLLFAILLLLINLAVFGVGLSLAQRVAGAATQPVAPMSLGLTAKGFE
jgi:hypothetical protein